MSNYKKFCVPCASCAGLTSKSYARANGGKCKACATGVPKAEKATTLPCDECGKQAPAHYERPWQEYAGAMPHGGYWSYECPNCGHCGRGTADFSNFAIRENTRGW